jgi:TonB family protein
MNPYISRSGRRIVSANGCLLPLESNVNRALAVLLVLFPGMLVAQSIPSNPPQTTAASALHASLVAPPHSPGSNPDDQSRARPATVSSGLILPRLLKSVPVIAPGRHLHLTARTIKVVVEYTIDKHGTPTNAHVVVSANPTLDEEVLAALPQFHYQPGTLDGQPIEYPMQLQYIVDKGAEY